MSLDALGNIGDFVGGLGVVITLIYLAVQIRQNTATVRASGSASHNEGFNSVFLLLSQDNDARDIYFRGLVDYEALSAEQQLHFDLLAIYILQSILGSFYLHREGAISDDAWQDALFWLSSVTSQPGFHSMWEKWRSRVPPGLRKFVDGTLTSTSAPGAPPV
jgi:hypothetical protein